MRARVTQLWQTRLLRYSKLTVADEIENALSYYEATFLREIPKLYADLERALGTSRCTAFCAWASGLAATATATPTSAPHTLVHALRRQAEVALRHYLTEVHALGGELSLSAHAGRGARPRCRRWPSSSPDTQRAPQDEPYRRALTGIYARLAATLHELTGGEAARHAVAPQNPYAERREFLAELRTIEASLPGAPWCRRWSAQRLRPLIRAVQVFGFHLATVDLRQSSDQHERVVAELLAVAAHRARLCRAARRRRRPLLLRLLQDARPLRVRGRCLLRAHERRAGHLRSGKAAHAPNATAHEAIRHYIISHTETVSDLLEVLLLQKEVGLMHGTLDDAAPTGQPTCRPDRGAAVRDHRRPAQRRAHHARVLRAAGHRRHGAAQRRRAGHHAGLLRQQQGRRHLHQQLGAVPRRDRAGGAV
jgi:phosphoenolpyruvate carboxylase